MATHMRPAFLFALLSLSACAGLMPKPAKLLIRNQTAETPFCRVELKDPPKENQFFEQNIAAGQQSELAVKAGHRKVCVQACEPRVGMDGQHTNIVGCQEMDVTAAQPTEIVIADGPDKPNVPATPGYTQVMWGNNVNPVFAQSRNKPWLDPFGRIREGMLSMSIEHPGVCPKTIHFKWEDKKGLGQRAAIDPKQTLPLASDRPPLWLFFATEARDLKKVWDLPAGVYVIKVRDDCKGFDLADQKYAASATDKAKPVTGEK
jgi:hypothetical protein